MSDTAIQALLLGAILGGFTIALIVIFRTSILDHSSPRRRWRGAAPDQGADGVPNRFWDIGDGGGDGGD